VRSRVVQAVVATIVAASATLIASARPAAAAALTDVVPAPAAVQPVSGVTHPGSTVDRAGHRLLPLAPGAMDNRPEVRIHGSFVYLGAAQFFDRRLFASPVYPTPLLHMTKDPSVDINGYTARDTSRVIVPLSYCLGL